MVDEKTIVAASLVTSMLRPRIEKGTAAKAQAVRVTRMTCDLQTRVLAFISPPAKNQALGYRLKDHQ